MVLEQSTLPVAAGAEIDDFIKQVRSFDASAAAGPSGLRPQFIRELVGEGGDMIQNADEDSLELTLYNWTDMGLQEYHFDPLFAGAGGAGWKARFAEEERNPASSAGAFGNHRGVPMDS